MKKYHTGKLKYGSISVLMIVMVMAALIVLNAGVYALEKKKGWRVDLSFNGIVSQSKETGEVLKSLQDPVEIYALFRKGDEDAPLMELLDRYAAACDQVTWKQVDPSMNPALLKRFTTDSVAPGSNDLIVCCEKTGRFRVLGPDDYVSVGMDTETGEYTYTGWTYESSITGVLAYVTKERVPKVVILQGHGEMDSETLQYFQGLLEANQYDVVFEDMTAASFAPDPEDLLIFFSPVRDLTEPELQKLSDFAAKGGSFLFSCDYTDPTGTMPNYAALLRAYGFKPLEGIVIADTADEGTYYDKEHPYWLLPEMCSTDLTLSLITAGANHLLLPGARAFEEPEESDRNLTAAVVLRSGKTAYRKVLTAQTSSIEKTGEDNEGAFPLALEARRVTTEGYVSRAFIIGCSAALADQQVFAMTDSQQVTIRVMEFLLKTDASDLMIAPKEAIRPALGTASTGLGSILLVVLPLSVLFAALLILGPRRSR